MAAPSNLIRIAAVVPQGDSGVRNILLGVLTHVERLEQWWLEIFANDPAGLEAVEKWRPAGIIASLDTPALGQWASLLKMPVVNISSAFAVPGIAHVGVNDENIGELAASDFIEHGFRDLGFVGAANHQGTKLREQGFRKRLATVGIEEIWSIAIDDPAAKCAPGHAALPELLTWIKTLPLSASVGVFCGDDYCARLLGQAANAAKIELPGDMAIMGCGDDELVCRANVPPLSSITLPLELVGYEAAVLLERLMAGEDVPAEPKLLPVSSVSRRKSTNVVPIPDPDVAAAVRFIQAHAGEWIGVPEILLAVPINRRSLERKFRQYLGRSPLEEIRRLRLELAKKMLANTDLSMPIVARRSGFSEAKQLSLVFHETIGITPTAYRQQFRVPAERDEARPASPSESVTETRPI